MCLVLLQVSLHRLCLQSSRVSSLSVHKDYQTNALEDEAKILHTRLDGDGAVILEENQRKKCNEVDESFEEV